MENEIFLHVQVHKEYGIYPRYCTQSKGITCWVLEENNHVFNSDISATCDVFMSYCRSHQTAATPVSEY